MFCFLWERLNTHAPIYVRLNWFVKWCGYIENDIYLYYILSIYIENVSKVFQHVPLFCFWSGLISGVYCPGSNIRIPSEILGSAWCTLETVFTPPCVSVFTPPCVSVFARPCVSVFTPPCVSVFTTPCVSVFTPPVSVCSRPLSQCVHDPLCQCVHDPLCQSVEHYGFREVQWLAYYNYILQYLVY